MIPFIDESVGYWRESLILIPKLRVSIDTRALLSFWYQKISWWPTVAEALQRQFDLSFQL